MNDWGKINSGLILTVLIAVVILSVGFFSLSSSAQDSSSPDTPVVEDNADDTPEAIEEEPVDESSEEGVEETDEAIEEPPTDEPVEGVEDEELKSHRDRTPNDLKTLGIFFKDEEGSTVAERTVKILEVNLPSAMQRKNDEARSYQTLNMEGRLDPLYPTDFIPDELRPELEGEGISGAVDSGLINQLIERQINQQFKYIQIHIIGTMQNGPYKSAMVQIPALGYYDIMTEGSGPRITMSASPDGRYVASITCTGISEVAVTMRLSATLYDWVYGRPIASTEPVTRHFYIRRYQ